MAKKSIPEPQLPPDRAAQLIWFDPGTTTGVAVVSLNPAWLEGEDSGAPVGFKRALHTVSHFQLGKNARGHEELAQPDDLAVDAIEDRAAGWLWEARSVLGGLGVIHSLPFAAWGYEDFKVRMISGDDDFLSPARVGSSLRDFMVLTGDVRRAPFIQLPALGLVPDNPRMMEAGLYKRGMPHATDAARHALTFYRRARQDPKLRAQAWPYLFGGSK